MKIMLTIDAWQMEPEGIKIWLIGFENHQCVSNFVGKKEKTKKQMQRVLEREEFWITGEATRERIPQKQRKRRNQICIKQIIKQLFY